MSVNLWLTEANVWKAQPEPRPGVALPSRAVVMLTRAFCSLRCAKLFVSSSQTPLSFPESPPRFPFSLLHWLRPVWLCKGPRCGVGFYSNRPSIDPPDGSPLSPRGHSTGALSLCILATPHLHSLRRGTDVCPILSRALAPHVELREGEKMRHPRNEVIVCFVYCCCFFPFCNLARKWLSHSIHQDWTPSYETKEYSRWTKQTSMQFSEIVNWWRPPSVWFTSFTGK